MRGSLAAIVAAAVLSAAHLGAEERPATQGSHLVSLEAAQARLLEAAAQRERNLATLDAFVTSPEGAAAVTAVGLSRERVRGALATLSDGELQDLALRAAALETDPTAGAFTARQVVWIAAIALAVVLLVAIL